MIYKGIFQICLFLTFLAGNLFSQTFSESARIEKVFKTRPSTMVDITNKYGMIHIVPWEKDSVRILIELSVKSSSISRLDKIMNNIAFDFTDTDYYIIVKTVFGKKYNKLFDELRNLAETFIPSDNVVKIDYTVMMPEENELNIHNKFGNIYIDNHSGDLNLVLSNGDLKANALNGNVIIDLNMGDGVINYIKNGKLNISYSNLRIKNTNELTLGTRTSKINIDTVNNLKIHSRRDKYYIEKSTSISGETYFSNLWVYDLSKDLNLILKYGSLNLEYIHNDFSFLNINSNYTDLSLVFERDAAYQIDISHKNTGITYPEYLGKLEKKAIDVKEKEFMTYGRMGNRDNSSKVKIDAIKGTIYIIHK